MESKAFSSQCRVTMVIIFSPTALAIENRCGSKKSILGILDTSVIAMALSKITASSPLHLRPLADWRTWWTPDIPETIAKAMKYHIKVRKLPGNGCILNTSHFNGDVIKDAHISSVAEALLVSYPKNWQPSGYLLGDVVLKLDDLWNGSLLGGAQESPIMERSRRDNALSEGGRLKKLLSYVRTSALKSENGKTAEVTYLKSLANQRPVRTKRSSSVASTDTSVSTMSNATTLVLG